MTQCFTADQLRAASMYGCTPAELVRMRATNARRTLASTTLGIEMRGVAIILASDWERLAASIDRGMGVCDPIEDEFWATRFSPMTTKWIYDHPRLDEVAEAFDRYVLIMRGHFDFTRPQYVPLLKQPC